MSIQSINVYQPAGQVGVSPYFVYISTTDTAAQVQATGYLTQAAQTFGFTFSNDQTALVTTSDEGNLILQVSVASGVVSLTAPDLVATQVTASKTETSATPGTFRAVIGSVTSTATTITSGNLVGVRGVVTEVGASGGFVYGTQGKVIATGTLSGSSWTAGVFGQFDISSATINAGQTAAIWGDYGATSGTITDASGMRGIAMTNTTAAVLNAQDYRYGNATYLLELAGAGGTLNYYAAAGTSAGSAGDAAHCAAQQVLKIEVNGVAAYIPVFTQNT